MSNAYMPVTLSKDNAKNTPDLYDNIVLCVAPHVLWDI